MVNEVGTTLTSRSSIGPYSHFSKLYLTDHSPLWVEADNGEPLSTTVADAAKASQIIEEIQTELREKQELTKQLTLLKQVLGNWFQSHRDVLKEAYLQTKSEVQFFVVVLQGYQYNEQIEDSLTDLTIEVANNPELNKIQLDVQCLPHCGKDDIQSFLTIGGVPSDGNV